MLGREAELAGGLLLQGGGAERRVRRAPVRLALHAGHREARVLQPLGQGGRRRGVQVQDILGAQFARGGEVAALGHPAAVDGDQAGGEARRLVGVLFAVILRGELGLEVGVAGRAEGDPLALPVHDQPGRDRLHPPGGQLGHDLLPQHGRDLVPVQPVQHAARLVGVHQALVHLTRVGDGAGDRLRGDLVEHHPAVRHLGLELLEQVPGDGLALAVFIGGEQQFVGVLEQALELGHLLPLVAVHDVERLEVVVHVDAEPGPRLAAVLGRDLRGAVGHVPDVAHAGLDHVALAEVPGYRPGLRRGLDDDELGAVAVPAIPAPLWLASARPLALRRRLSLLARSSRPRLRAVTVLCRPCGHAPPCSNNRRPGSVCSLGLTGPERRFCHRRLNHR